MPHYLRVEAVNLYASVYDTNQISIIRGGSLLLKQAIDDLAKKFTSQLTPLSTGASVGLFEITDANPASLKPAVIDFLNTENNYHYFTFVVVDAAHDDFQTAKEILVAKIRVLQLQQPSLSVDENMAKAQPCALDGIRKAQKEIQLARGKTIINPFARLKWVYGRRQRKKLYHDELKELDLPTNDLDFTQDLTQLSKNPDCPNLDGKIAVIYFDGNGFSKLQADLVRTAQDQKDFDRTIKNYRRDFLDQLLQRCEADPDWRIAKKNRLETLLWGGDEMLFVVPAWKGFELMGLFYQISQNWHITLNEQTKRLTHAGGMVFCQYNSPIYKMRELAQALADRIKGLAGGRDGNYYDYLALESIDYPAEALDCFFKYRYGDLSAYRTCLSATGLAETDLPALAPLRANLPKSQVYAIALAASKLSLTDHEAFDKALARLSQLIGNETLENILTPLTTLLSPQLNENIPDTAQQALIWLHLVQCWDYLWPEKTGSAL